MGSGPGLACAEFKMRRVSQWERPEMKSGGCEGNSSLKGGWGDEGQSECGRGRKKELERSSLRLGKPRCGRGCSGKQDGYWFETLRKVPNNEDSGKSLGLVRS